MPNHSGRTRNAVLAVAVSLALTFGVTGRSFGDNGDITATLKVNNDVGVAFPGSMGSGPEYSPEGGFFDIYVTLQAPSGWLIIASDTTDSGDGATLWNCTNGSTGLVSNQTWEGIGVTSSDDWSDVFFAGNLTKPGTGPGNGTPPPFWASVADTSIYVDALGLHQDQYWTPQVSDEEHQAETSEDGGLYLPPAIVTTGSDGAFPTQLPSDCNYKLLILRLKTPQWVGSASSDGNVGNANFTVPTGVALYDCGTGALVRGGSVSQTTRVPPGGFPSKQFAVVTDQNFAAADCIEATFTWDSPLTGGPATCQDYARVAPIAVDFVRIWDANQTANRTTRAIIPALWRQKLYEDNDRSDCELPDDAPLLVLGAWCNQMAQANVNLQCQFQPSSAGARILWKIQVIRGTVSGPTSGSFASGDTIPLTLIPTSEQMASHDDTDFIITVGIDWNGDGVLSDTEVCSVPFGVRLIGKNEYDYCNTQFPGWQRTLGGLSIYPDTMDLLNIFLHDIWTPSYESDAADEIYFRAADEPPMTFPECIYYDQKKGRGCDPTSIIKGSLHTYTWSPQSGFAVRIMTSTTFMDNALKPFIQGANVLQYYTDNPGVMSHTFTTHVHSRYLFNSTSNLALAIGHANVDVLVSLNTERSGSGALVDSIEVFGKLYDVYTIQTMGGDEPNGWGSRLQVCYASACGRTAGNIFKVRVRLEHDSSGQGQCSPTDVDGILNRWIGSFQTGF